MGESGGEQSRGHASEGAGARRSRRPHSRGQRSDAAPRHVEEGAGAGARAQGGLDAAQEVVGLEDEQHLAGHVGEELADLGQVGGRVVADLDVLQQQQGDRHGWYEKWGPGWWVSRQPVAGGAARKLQEGAARMAASCRGTTRDPPQREARHKELCRLTNPDGTSDPNV